MARERKIDAHFSEKRKYFENQLGTEFDFTQASGPYEYLLGALSGCFYLTLRSFSDVPLWDSADITVTGHKRDEIPTTLKETVLDITIHNASDKERVSELIARAERECSIFATISSVSEMKVNIIYADRAL